MAEQRVQAEALHDLSMLVGRWRGRGSGDYPTMEPFDYEEEIVFSPLSERAVRYTQLAWAPADGEVLHMESGIWRLTRRGRLEVTIALPGVAEVSEGTATPETIRLASTSMARAEEGAELLASVRSYDLGGPTMTYDIQMGTSECPTQRHIWARLTRHG